MACRRYTAEEILAVLDERARRFAFPCLDNGYVYLADVRLHAFRDPSRWAVVIEMLGTNNRTHPGAGAIDDCVYWFGNTIEGEDMEVRCPVDDGPSAPLATEWDLLVDEAARDITLRGRVVPIPRAPEHYAARGIVLSEPPRITVFELLRALLPEHRDALLATPEEVRRRIPPDLPHLLTCEAWHHPDIAGRDEERPSRLESFRSLAHALVEGDASLFQPGTPNTHWSNWPEGGTL